VLLSGRIERLIVLDRGATPAISSIIAGSHEFFISIRNFFVAFFIAGAIAAVAFLNKA
jgi:hypothetical protein